MLITLIALYGWLFLSIVLHELGHVCAAKRLGMLPISVHVGVGPLLLRTTLAGVPWEVRAIPANGLTRATHPSLFTFRINKLLLAAAGPAVNLALLIPLAWLFYFAPFDALQHGLPRYLLRIFTHLEFFLLIGNLLPYMTRVQGDTVGSDGKQIWEALRTNQQALNQSFVENVHQHLLRYARPEQVAQPFGGNSELLNRLFKGHAALQTRNYDDAVDYLEKLLEVPELQPHEKVFIYEQLTTIALNHGAGAYLQRALSWAEHALAMQPANPTLRGTKGALLIENGNIEEGLALLLPLTEPGNSDLDRSISAAYLAKVEFMRGNIDTARSYLKLAESSGLAQEFIQRLCAPFVPQPQPQPQPAQATENLWLR